MTSYLGLGNIARVFSSTSRWMAVGTLLVFGAASAGAADLVQIEEDWELVIADPDPGSFAPQVTCTFSPSHHLSGLYAVFDLNLKNLPSYEAGGVQLQLWNGDSPVAAVRSHTGQLLSSSGETVRWTKRMSLDGGNLTVAIVNGTSQSWGTFGTGSSISVSSPTNLANLNSYSPPVTFANSGVSFSAHRVTSLTLTGIRGYSQSGLEAHSTTPVVVYPH